MHPFTNHATFVRADKILSNLFGYLCWSLPVLIQSDVADVISFDILLDNRMDLLTDSSFESLLKVCASGAVAYGAASPCCSQYSRLKLRRDSGPPPLRTPEFLQGVPGLSAEDLAKVQESYTMLSRCLQVLV